MPAHPARSADDLRDLAAALGLPLTAAEADASLGPVSTILDSLAPLDEALEDGRDVPAAEPVEAEDPHNAFITRCEVAPTRSDGPLAGVTVALKDNIALAGVPQTAGSAVLEDCVPARNAPVVDRLLDAGARLVGKTNMDEFAFGPTGETSAFGPTTNPVDPAYTPGGSSSGSAAAVASGAADLALGTDTGGSVRIPASYTGVIGLKPTLGIVPADGVVELSGSLDTVGLLGTDLDRVAAGYAVLAGEPAAGAGSADGAESPGGDGPAPVEPGSLTVGLPDALFDDPVDPAVADHVRAVVDELGAAGASVRTVPFPGTAATSAAWRAIAMSELYCYLRDAARPYRRAEATSWAVERCLAEAGPAALKRLSAPLKRYLLVGAALVTTDGGRTYGRARNVQPWLARQVDAAFESVDVLATPTTPTTAYRFGAFSRDTSPPINRNTHPFNLTGHPALSLPAGELDDLPVGLQLVTPHGTEAFLLRVARTVLDVVAD